MSKIPALTFSNGHKMPIFGLGTYLSDADDLENVVKEAINLGYRHFDTAYFYGNEKAVGSAIQAKIKDGTVTRDELFVTTKLWNTFHREKDVVPICKKSLENLGLDYMDLYLVHWPFAFKEGDDLMPHAPDGEILSSDVDYLETWRGMEECVHQGLTRSIGISNFNSEQITRLLAAAKIKPVNNQFEVSVNLKQKELIEFCKKHNITVTGYSPLGRPGNRLGVPNSLDNPKIVEIAQKYHKTPAQVALRYTLQQDVAIIPKTVTISRLQENFNIFDFTLTADDLAVIDKIGTGERTAPFTQVKDHKYYPFTAPF
ncbi:hypothetical protein KM043_006473 [Ampulex compressa]|nr:hypothetical protein KM043_006473 [Ampulex compressa]